MYSFLLIIMLFHGYSTEGKEAYSYHLMDSLFQHLQV